MSFPHHSKPNNELSLAYRISRVGILSALAVVGRLALAVIPNVQPVSVIILIITLTMGTIDGMLVAVLSILLSNILLGMGPWTLAQIASYVIISLLTGWFVRPFYKPNAMANRIAIAVYAGFTGLLYGFIISIFMVKMFGVVAFWPYYLRGIPFDLMHAGGNIAFYFILEPILSRILLRQK